MIGESAGVKELVEIIDGAGFDPPSLDEPARDLVIASYEVPRSMYTSMPKRCGVKRLGDLGALVYYGDQCGRMRLKGVKKVDVDALVERWRVTVAGLCLAHDKDEADRHEAALDECLTPLLSAPIKQVREFADKLAKALKDDPKVPFLAWRAYEVWVEMMVKNAKDTELKQLKTELAKEIVHIVEADIVPQIPEALARSLQWRSPEKLEEIRELAESEKVAGRKPRLKGRESCLFLELGGTDDEPKVVVQI